MYDNYEGYHIPPTYLYAPIRQDYENEWINGDATWTEGGPLTKCNLSWSDLNGMTTAVSPDSDYACGEWLNVKFRETSKEVTVKVVDTVAGYPPHRLNLHRQAFQALGANLDWGMVPINISVVSTDGNGHFRDVMMNVLRQTYPDATLRSSQWQGEESTPDGNKKETYLFTLMTGEQELLVQGEVVYNPTTNRIRSINIYERFQ